MWYLWQKLKAELLIKNMYVKDRQQTVFVRKISSIEPFAYFTKQVLVLVSSMVDLK